MDCNKIKYIHDTFDIPSLMRTGFLHDGMTYHDIERRICLFFGLLNIYQYDYIVDEEWVLVRADIKTFSIN